MRALSATESALALLAVGTVRSLPRTTMAIIGTSAHRVEHPGAIAPG